MRSEIVSLRKKTDSYPNYNFKLFHGHLCRILFSDSSSIIRSDVNTSNWLGVPTISSSDVRPKAGSKMFDMRSVASVVQSRTLVMIYVRALALEEI